MYRYDASALVGRAIFIICVPRFTLRPAVCSVAIAA